MVCAEFQRRLVNRWIFLKISHSRLLMLTLQSLWKILLSMSTRQKVSSVRLRSLFFQKLTKKSFLEVLSLLHSLECLIQKRKRLVLLKALAPFLVARSVVLEFGAASNQLLPLDLLDRIQMRYHHKTSQVIQVTCH